MIIPPAANNVAGGMIFVKKQGSGKRGRAYRGAKRRLSERPDNGYWLGHNAPDRLRREIAAVRDAEKSGQKRNEMRFDWKSSGKYVIIL